MPARIDIPPGTVFGRLTVIEEARTAGGRRAMLCRCECGKQAVVDLAKLRSGHTRSCGCRRWEIGRTTANPGEIPLYGKVAAGRVTLIDESDSGLVGQYRWNAQEWRKGGRLVAGPYATTSLSRRDHGGKAPTLLMHVLIMGQPYIDHINGNGLDNRRSNLRPATAAQNAANRRMEQSGLSSYKGVALVRASGRWIAHIGHEGKQSHLGVFASELSAAYAYDLAAREAFGEFAHTNFDTEPPQEVLDAWRVEEDRRPRASSGFKGVYRDRRAGRWQAQIWVDGHNRTLGTFDDAAEAARAYDAAAMETRGMSARLNFP